MKILLFVLFFLLAPLLLFFSCSGPTSAISQPQPVPEAKALGLPGQAWEREWQEIVARAKKEKKVVAYLFIGAEARDMIVNAFQGKYGVEVEAITIREWGARILTERKAGIQFTDLSVGGSTTMITQLKPPRVIDRLEPWLILPEVLDGKSWIGGALPWLDEDKQILSFSSYVNSPMSRNKDLVSPAEIQTYADLLNPRWKGKIVMANPTLPGSALKWFGVVGTGTRDMDFMRELAKQEIAIHNDDRLLTEWLARGKYSMGIGLKTDTIDEFISAGAPISHLMPEKEIAYTTSGAGNLVVLREPAHPNAAKLFINWLLSQEGQTVWVKARRLPSVRADVTLEGINPVAAMDPKKKYFNADTEKFIAKQDEQAKMAREIFGPLMK